MADYGNLSGDVAYRLFVSSDPFPLHDFLEKWKQTNECANVGFVLAVIGAYNRMVERHNGKRDGTYRPKVD